MDTTLLQEWLAAFDAILDAKVRRAQARRRMKFSLAALAASLTLLAVDARIASALLQSAAPTDVAKWLTIGFTMVSAVVTIAITFTVTRVTVKANQQATEAALAERVHIEAFTALQKQVDRQHGEIRHDIDRHRDEIRSDIAALRKEVIIAVQSRAS